MYLTMLKSKIHRATITGADLNYEGSISIDVELMKQANLYEFEKVDVYNVTNGERFSTYLILAEAGSKTLSVNGAAAHKVSIDDVVIICTYGSYDETEAKTHTPTLVYFDKSNNVTKVKNTIPEQKLKSV